MNLNLYDALKSELDVDRGVQKFMRELGEFFNNKSKTENELEQKRQEYRKEGHLYLVTEDREGTVYLWDLTDRPKEEIEEVDFPEELVEKATEGSVFKYTNGTYEFYSEDGYDMLFNEN